MTRSLLPIGSERGLSRSERSPFALLQQEIDRLFDGFGRNFPSFSNDLAVMPRMDVAETDQAIEVSAELPGLETKDVQLNLTDNLLTIRGEKKSERAEKQKDYHLVERSYGSFARSVQLPDGVTANDITAEIAKGVLKVTVKKPAPKQSKPIEIKAAG
jgi:HSP20 family protein